jgi:hypothetical protein
MKLTTKAWTAIGAVLTGITVLLMLIFFFADHSKPVQQSPVQQTSGAGSVAVNGNGNSVITNAPQASASSGSPTHSSGPATTFGPKSPAITGNRNSVTYGDEPTPKAGP